jgi:hypothetical protein
MRYGNTAYRTWRGAAALVACAGLPPPLTLPGRRRNAGTHECWRRRRS